MTRKKVLIIICVSAFFAVSYTACTAFAKWVFRDEPTYPKLPTKSSENTITITSNGCCFWVENVVVSLLDGNKQKTIIATKENLSGHDIFKYEIPLVTEAPLSLFVEFRCFYGDESDFSMLVMDFANIESMKKTGVLLYFQEHDDMYLNVIAGKNHISYKMGDQWATTSVPNKVYP